MNRIDGPTATHICVLPDIQIIPHFYPPVQKAYTRSKAGLMKNYRRSGPRKLKI